MTDTLHDLHTIADLPSNLRVGQTLAIEKSIDHFARHDRGILWMCCGSGKTVACAVTIELRHEPVTVVFTPYIHLVKQWREDYLKWLPDTKAKFLCVCSEKDTDQEGDFRQEAKLLSSATTLPAEEFAELVEEAKRSGGQTSVSTDPDEIATFLKQPGQKIVFCTYASAPIYGWGQSKAGVKANFGVFDEAQMTAAGGQSNLYTYALRDDRVSIHQRLFTTATVRHYTREGLEFSMDNEEVYGGHILLDDKGNPDPWTIRKAIDHHEVAPYRVLLSFIADSKLTPDLAGQSPYREILADIGAKAKPEEVLRFVGHVFALERAKEKYGVKKPLGFLRSVASANLYTDILNACKKYPEFFPHLSQSERAIAISSYDPVSKRKNLMGHLKNSPETEINNARLFIFGADEKSLDAVMFNDPMSSRENVVQASGRPQRYVEGKTATIIVPVMLPSIGDPSFDVLQLAPEAIKGAFRPVIDILDRLADMDPILRNQMTYGLRGDWKGPTARVIDLDFPRELFTDFQNQIEVAIWRQINPDTDFIDKLLFDAAALNAYRLQQYPTIDDATEENIAVESRGKIRIIPQNVQGFEVTKGRMKRLRLAIAEYLEADGREGAYGGYFLMADRVQLVFEIYGWDHEFVLKDNLVEMLRGDARALEAYRLQQYPKSDDTTEEARAADKRVKIRIIADQKKGMFAAAGVRMGLLRREIRAYFEANEKEGKYGNHRLTAARVRQVLEIYGWDRVFVLQDAFVEALKEDAQALEAFRFQQYPRRDDPIGEALAAAERAKIKIVPYQKTGLFVLTGRRMGALRRYIGHYFEADKKEKRYGEFFLTTDRVQRVFEIYGWDREFIARYDFVDKLKEDVQALEAFRFQQYPRRDDPTEEDVVAKKRGKIRIIPQHVQGFEVAGGRMERLRRAIVKYLEADGKEGLYGSYFLGFDRVQRVFEIFGWDNEFILRDDFIEKLKEDTEALEAYRLQQYPKSDNATEEARAAVERAKIKITPYQKTTGSFASAGQRMWSLRRDIKAYFEADMKEGRYPNHFLTSERVQRILEIYGWDREFILQDKFVETLKADAQILDIFRLQQHPRRDDPIEETRAAERRAKIKIIPTQQTGSFAAASQRMGRMCRELRNYFEAGQKDGKYRSFILTADRVRQVFEIYGWDKEFVLNGPKRNSPHNGRSKKRPGRSPK